MRSFGIIAYAAVARTGFADVDANAWDADAAVYGHENFLMVVSAKTSSPPRKI